MRTKVAHGAVCRSCGERIAVCTTRLRCFQHKDGEQRTVARTGRCECGTEWQHGRRRLGGPAGACARADVTAEVGTQGLLCKRYSISHRCTDTACARLCAPCASFEGTRA